MRYSTPYQHHGYNPQRRQQYMHNYNRPYGTTNNQEPVFKHPQADLNVQPPPGHRPYSFYPDPNRVDELLSLTRHNHYREVEAILNTGVAPNVRDAYGNTILITACQNGLKRIAKLALRRGADINLQNFNGNTALHYCFGLSYGETLGSYLISKGADPNIRNNFGQTCYEGFREC